MKIKKNGYRLIFRMFFRHWRAGKIIYTGRPVPIGYGKYSFPLFDALTSFSRASMGYRRIFMWNKLVCAVKALFSARRWFGIFVLITLGLLAALAVFFPQQLHKAALVSFAACVACGWTA